MLSCQIKNFTQSPVLSLDFKKKFEKNGVLNPAAIVKNKRVFLFYQAKDKNSLSSICLAVSQNGLKFKKYLKNPIIKEKGAGCENPRIIRTQKGYFLTYEKIDKGNKTYLCGAFSKNLLTWQKIGKIIPARGPGAIVQDYQDNGKYLMYFGRNSIRLSFSEDLKIWKAKRKTVLSLRKRFFDSHQITPGPPPIIINDKIVLIYNAVQKTKKGEISPVKSLPGKFNRVYSWGLAVFDKKDPSKLLERPEKPIIDLAENKVLVSGLIKFRKEWLIYYSRADKAIGVAKIIFPAKRIKAKKFLEFPKLTKFEGNPILEPRKIYPWESKGTFNATAIYEQGKVYLIYRSITEDDVSVLGLAVSEDGINISQRLKEPIYFPRESFEINPSGQRTYGWLSGGGHSGCEDPRIVKIEDRFYLCYVAFDGHNPPRIALTSIKDEDFLNYQWNWQKPILISPPGLGDKQACLFPEKFINGNYVFFHRIFPHIWIDFVPDLKFENRWLAGNIFAEPRPDKWDSEKIGASATPLKTKRGWLLIYNGVGKNDFKYKIGAMLLDLKNPCQILARSNEPILVPDGAREGSIVYSCGAVIIKEQLYVYYGQNDYSLGVATANLDEFLEKLIKNKL